MRLNLGELIPDLLMSRLPLERALSYEEGNINVGASEAREVRKLQRDEVAAALPEALAIEHSLLMDGSSYLKTEEIDVLLFLWWLTLGH